MEDGYIHLLLPHVAFWGSDDWVCTGVDFFGCTVGHLCRGWVAGICLVPHLPDCKGVLLMNEYFRMTNEDIRREPSTAGKVLTLLMGYVVLPFAIVAIGSLILMILWAVVNSLIGSIFLGGAALIVAVAYTIVKVYFS